MTLLAILAALLAAAFFGLWRTADRKVMAAKGKVPGSPIPQRPIQEIDPLFALTRFGPSRDTEVAHIAQVHVEGGISDLESWILCNLAKSARRIFEFGTATGKTTYLMARSAPEARITTITLHPDDLDSGRHEKTDDKALQTSARRESAFADFLYSGTDAAPRIEQLFGDSKAFDETAYLEAFDLIFVDGAHTESYVRSDTQKALAMLAPGGWLVWHDYVGPRVPGVFKVLNALSRTLPLVRIKGTTFVAHHKPAG
ncbi:O-methyltransferase [Caulobacter sp. LARHSG274]